MIDPDGAVWYSGSGNAYNFIEVVEKITKTKKDNNSLEIHVGTDSDPNGKKCAIATGIALRIPGHGACYFWSRDYNQWNSLRYPPFENPPCFATSEPKSWPFLEIPLVSQHQTTGGVSRNSTD